jgi:hypothetical protein
VLKLVPQLFNTHLTAFPALAVALSRTKKIFIFVSDRVTLHIVTKLPPAVSIMQTLLLDVSFHMPLKYLISTYIEKEPHVDKSLHDLGQGT